MEFDRDGVGLDVGDTRAEMMFREFILPARGKP